MSEAQVNVPINKKTVPVIVLLVLVVGGFVYYQKHKPRQVNEHLKEQVMKEIQVEYHAALLAFTQKNKNTMTSEQFEQASANSDLTGRVTFPNDVLKLHPTRDHVYVLNVDILIDGKKPAFYPASKKFNVKRHSETRWEILPY
ncbi:MAG: hypothetical protein CMJ19_04305 [Phycisphaeraceae bacterium]|nr:hypothetical protein [Phycisphaeraceae bacterium]|tara:strand:+ start:123 stop:551 length:429 start_codon:yes stop_codon:yes gene_type:complete